MDGKKWMSLPVSESIPVGKLPNGAYFLRIILEGRQRVLRFNKME